MRGRQAQARTSVRFAIADEVNVKALPDQTSIVRAMMSSSL